MTKADLVRSIASQLEVSQASVDAVLTVLEETIKQEAKDTGEAIIPGLAMFKTKQRPARQGVNPRTGDPVDVPAKTVVRAKVYGPKRWGL